MTFFICDRCGFPMPDTSRGYVIQRMVAGEDGLRGPDEIAFCRACSVKINNEADAKRKEFLELWRNA